MAGCLPGHQSPSSFHSQTSKPAGVSGCLPGQQLLQALHVSSHAHNRGHRMSRSCMPSTYMCAGMHEHMRAEICTCVLMHMHAYSMHAHACTPHARRHAHTCTLPQIHTNVLLCAPTLPARTYAPHASTHPLPPCLQSASLKQRLVGQDAAVDCVAAALMRARCGLKSPNRPVASLLLVGPTGEHPPAALLLLCVKVCVSKVPAHPPAHLLVLLCSGACV